MDRSFLCGSSDKKEKHINMLYVQDSRNNNLGHFE